jgi:hypothetical protein
MMTYQTRGAYAAVPRAFGLVPLLVLAGCAQFLAQRHEAVAEQDQREAPMRQAAQMEDGHLRVDGGNNRLFRALQDIPANTPWKSCTTLARYQLEPGEPTAVSYDPNFKAYVEPLIDEGKLARDLYYAAATTSQFIVSVPLSDRAELAQNMEAGAVCIWVNAPLTELPNPVNPDRTETFGVYYVPLEKWDGVLRHQAQAPPTQVAGTAVQGGDAPPVGDAPDGPALPAASPQVSAVPAADALLGKWRSDQVAGVTMEFRADEFRWMAMIATIRKVRYEVDGATVLVIQVDGAGQVERFRIVDANHIVFIQPMMGEIQLTRVSEVVK